MTSMIGDLLRLLRGKILTPKRMGSVATDCGRRKIAWAEFGSTSPSARTLIYFHGTPMCRYEPKIHGVGAHILDFTKSNGELHDIYEKHNVRVICIERPGFGSSTYVPNRSVAHWANDVLQVIESDEIGIRNKKFYVLGFSAGGPYALAIRNLLPHRVIGAAIVAGSGNVTSTFRSFLEKVFFSLPHSAQAAVYASAINSVILSFYLIRSALLLTNTIIRHFFRSDADGHLSSHHTSAIHPVNQKSITANAMGQMLSEGAEKLESVIGLLREATKQGFQGIVVDTLACQDPRHPWGFDVKAKTYVTTSSSERMAKKDEESELEHRPLPPLLLYYSKEDMTVPVEVGHWLASQVHGESIVGADFPVSSLRGDRRPYLGNLVWLSGGHNCMFLHLDKILTDLLALGQTYTSQ